MLDSGRWVTRQCLTNELLGQRNIFDMIRQGRRAQIENRSGGLSGRDLLYLTRRIKLQRKGLQVELVSQRSVALLAFGQGVLSQLHRLLVEVECRRHVSTTLLRGL